MVTGSDSMQDAIVKLSAGNPDALRVLYELLQSDPVMGFMRILDADDMGLKGPSIWLGYKDFAKENLDTFMKALESRDPEMVRVIKANGGEAWASGRS